jgi:hypothetical protein
MLLCCLHMLSLLTASVSLAEMDEGMTVVYVASDPHGLDAVSDAASEPIACMLGELQEATAGLGCRSAS